MAAATENSESSVPFSRFRGVQWHKPTRRWRASIKHGGKKLALGSYDDERDAAQAFDTAAIRFRGARANTNFPREHYPELAACIEGSNDGPEPPRVHIGGLPFTECGYLPMSHLDELAPQLDAEVLPVALSPQPVDEQADEQSDGQADEQADGHAGGGNGSPPLDSPPHFEEEDAEELQRRALAWARSRALAIATSQPPPDQPGVAGDGASTWEPGAWPLAGAAPHAFAPSVSPDGGPPEQSFTAALAAAVEAAQSRSFLATGAAPLPARYRPSARYKGVTLCEEGQFVGQWRAHVGGEDGEEPIVVLGYTDKEVDAARMHDRAILARRGPSAPTNLPAASYAARPFAVAAGSGTGVAETFSKYKGVTRVARTNKWTAKIKTANRKVHLGTFTDEVAAARAYDVAAIAKKGAAAKTNFPASDYDDPDLVAQVAKKARGAAAVAHTSNENSAADAPAQPPVEAPAPPPVQMPAHPMEQAPAQPPGQPVAQLSARSMAAAPAQPPAAAPEQAAVAGEPRGLGNAPALPPSASARTSKRKRRGRPGAAAGGDAGGSAESARAQAQGQGERRAEEGGALRGGQGLTRWPGPERPLYEAQPMLPLQAGTPQGGGYRELLFGDAGGDAGAAADAGGAPERQGSAGTGAARAGDLVRHSTHSDVSSEARRRAAAIYAAAPKSSTPPASASS